MNEKSRRYLVERGDTLDSVSERLQIPFAELQYYHNIGSDIKNLITDNILPRDLEYIILPDHYRKEIPPPRFCYVDENIRKTMGITQKKYTVIQKIYSSGKLENTFHFKTTLTEDIQEGQKKITIQREKVWLNNEEISLTVENMYEEAGNIMYPLEIAINEDGSFASIINPEKIKARWEEKRPGLEEYYKSSISTDIFEHFNAFFDNIFQFQEALTNDVFFKTFFVPLYRNYPYEEPAIYKDTFTLFPYKEGILYDVSLSPNVRIGRSGKFFIHLTGSYADSKKADEVWGKSAFQQNEIPKMEGNIDIQYKLCAETKRIFEVYGYIELKAGEMQRKIEVEIIEQLEN